MTIRIKPNAAITNPRELFMAQEVLDAYEANLGVISLADYFSIRRSVMEYIAKMVAQDRNWEWSTPGAVQDILLELRRSMETQESLQKEVLSEEDLLRHMYLCHLPAINSMAA